MPMSTSDHQLPRSDPITATDLDRVLLRAKDDDALGRKVAAAVALIEGVLDDLGEDAVALSFNGGKDCTVLLHLFAAVLYERHNAALAEELRLAHAKVPLPLPSAGTPKESEAAAANGTNANGTEEEEDPRTAYYNAPPAPPPPLPSCVVSSGTVHSTSTHHVPVTTGTSAQASRYPYPVIRSVYFTAPNPFPALEAFVIASAERYAMDLFRFGGGMKAALEQYLNCRGGKEIKAILLGTRQGDPNGNVAVLAPTDASWPQVLRVHPVLDWTYDEVWDFLRELDVPYCKLYDEGYTSLGSTHNTERNPLLRRPDGGYDPAYKLSDPTQERAGRNTSTKQPGA